MTVEAAIALASLTARGEGERAASVAAQVAPAGATVQVSTAGDTVVVVVVSARSAMLPGLDLRAQAVAVLEP